MSKPRLTCTRCQNTQDLTDDLRPGSDCPSCLQQAEMLPPEAGRKLGFVGKLIYGVPIFETSEWASSTLCDVGAQHDPHTWEADDQRFVCPGRHLANQERTFHVLLTQTEDGPLKVAGISRQLEPLRETFESWHDGGRTLWLLTLTDPQEGLPGVSLASVIPRHEFTTAFVPSDAQEGVTDSSDWGEN
jgi:hypothetical protein